jgi:hypothetical protein
MLHLQLRWTLIAFGSCIDLASYGSMMRFAGPSAKPYHIAIAQICYYRPRLFIHEITTVMTEYVVAKNRQLQDAGYKTMSMVLDPCNGGKPMKRPRRYSLGWLYAEGVRFWGSKDEALELFAMSVQVGGDVFFCTDEVRAKENRRRATNRGNVYAPTVNTSVLPLEHMFTSAYINNIEEHSRRRPQAEGFGGSFLLDAEQTPKFCPPGIHLKGAASPPTPQTCLFIRRSKI